MMPPVDWDFGPIPDACSDPALGCRDIEKLLLAVYLEPERVRRLADSDDEMELMRVKIAIEVVAEIDAGMIWAANAVRERQHDSLS